MGSFSLARALLLGGALATAAAGAGSVAEPAGYWLGDLEAPLPKTLGGARVAHVAEVAALLARDPLPVVMDVSNAPHRPAHLAAGAPWLPLPHRALPHAVWLPGAGAGAIALPVEDFYRARLREATAGDRDAPVVIYCHDKCWLSWNAAKRAVALGYHQVYWFPEGIEGWTAAGRPTVIAAPQGPGGDPPGDASPGDASPGGTGPKLVVLDIELTGDTGGPEFEAEHARRLDTESARLRLDLSRTGKYQVLDAGAAQATLDKLRSQQRYLHDCNGCDLDVGRELGADLVMVAWVDRVSGLILTLTYEMHDVRGGQITARRSFDFRGDSDTAWNHAVDYMVRHLEQ